ncbi:histidinol-phosphate transaminase [Helicobacter anseris]|uniref:Histidinol-phosphate aminotransferase n=1 Tax=Helicobacter anseris TaxID=375926 RepID=A0A3D8JAC4_9HELI|nr:histidinol-phosphate transaminase [Helicobacter anseris]RDU74250.1 histidinol-phosphate transaminase [Helicobacter anseris]
MIFNTNLNAIATYQAGKPIEEVIRVYGIDAKNIIKLASNENPYGCSPLVSQAICANASKVSLYPDDSMVDLKEALAKKYNLNAEHFIIGAGSDQIIEFCIRAKCQQDSKILMAKTTFAMYEIYAKQSGCQIIKTKSDMHNLKEFKELYRMHHPDIIFLCVPNNPLGECLDFSEVHDFLKEIDKNTLVVLDGAYQEYATYRDVNKAILVDVVQEFENVVYLKTFSKIYGLGGMRLGYGIASEMIMEYLYKIRPPFNVSSLSLLCGIEALKDENFIQKSLEQNAIEMQKYEIFAQENKIKYIESFTNFITFFLENQKCKSSEIAEFLMQNGVIIRDLKSYGLNAIRITIGTLEQNLKVFSLLKEKIS